MSKKSIPLIGAVLLVLNTMIGGGLFLNPKTLALVASALSPVAYIIAALLMLPIILTIADLARLQPVSGGLYVYSKEYLSPFAGFLSGWGYFLSKATSAAFLLHNVNAFFCSQIPFLQGVPSILLDATLLFFFATLHIVGISIAGKMQYLFSALKFTPLTFGFIAGFATFDKANLSIMPAEFSLSTLNTILPVCIYAFLSFEIICSIGGFIKNPAQNIRRAILIAFGFVSTAVILFQLLMFGALGASLSSSAFPMLALGTQFVGEHLIIAKVMNGLVFAAISGGAFFMIGSNCWNLHTLAKNGHLPFGNIISKLNRFGTPWLALLLQTCTSVIMIGISSNQVPLQTMVTFGVFGPYILSSFAAIQARRKGLLKLPIIVPILAIGTSSYILGVCLSNIIKFGISVSFLSFFLGGCALATYAHFTKKEA